MNIRVDELTSLVELGAHWWRGSASGPALEVTVILPKPEHRTDDEVVDLFTVVAAALSDGHAARTTVRLSAEPGITDLPD